MDPLTAERREYDALQCGLRVRRLQDLCGELQLDGILLVPGLDGQYNPGSHQAISYLLEGRSNRDVIDTLRLSDELEDLVLLVRPAGLSIYTSSKATEAVTDLLLPHVENLDFYTPTAREVDDVDLFEEAKVASFVQMLRSMKRLGVAFSAGSKQGAAAAGGAGAGGQIPPGVRLEQAALMELERWPLVQAYGLEGVGRQGFFTMNFEASPP